MAVWQVVDDSGQQHEVGDLVPERECGGVAEHVQHPRMRSQSPRLASRTIASDGSTPITDLPFQTSAGAAARTPVPVPKSSTTGMSTEANDAMRATQAANAAHVRRRRTQAAESRRGIGMR